MSNSLSMKILAELESKNVAAGAAQIVSSIRSIENATGNASAAMDKMEASMRAMVSLQKQQADAARAMAEMVKQQNAASEAAKVTRREATETARAQAAAAREAARAQVAAAREATAAARISAKESADNARAQTAAARESARAQAAAARETARNQVASAREAARVQIAVMREAARAQVQASREARRESMEAGRAQAAASREAAKALRDQARAEREVAREAKRRASEQMQAQNQLKSSALQAAAVAGGVGAAGTSLIKNAVSAAATYEEQTNELEVFFGENAKAADAWARNLGRSLGKGEASVRSLALNLQKNLAPILGTQEAYEYTKRLTQRAVDLGSLSDTDPETVAKNIISGLQGLPTPMRKYGATPLVGYLQQYENERADKEGRKGKRWDDMTYQERTRLRADYITEKTQHAEGDAERTANSTANTILRAQKTIDNVLLKLGQAFKESLQPVIKTVADLAEWFDRLSPATQRFAADLIVGGTALATMAGLIGVAAAAWWAYETAATAAKIATVLAGETAGGVRLAFMAAAPEIAAVTLALLAFIVMVGLAADIAEDLSGGDIIKGVINGMKAIVKAVAVVFGAILNPLEALEDVLIRSIRLASRFVAAMNAIPGFDSFIPDGLAGDLSGLADYMDAQAAGRRKQSGADVFDFAKGLFEPEQGGFKNESSLLDNVKSVFAQSMRGWEKILGGIYSNEDLMGGAKNRKGVGGEDTQVDDLPEGDSKEDIARRNAAAAMNKAAENANKRIAEAYKAAPNNLPKLIAETESEYAKIRREDELARAARAREAAKEAKEAADKARIQAKWVIIENEAAFREQRKAARLIERIANKMSEMWQDIASEILGRTAKLAQGDVAGAFSALGGSIGGLVEAAGVPFAGAIGSALDTVAAILLAPIQKIGGGLLSGANASNATSNAVAGAVSGAFAASSNPFTMAFGPIVQLTTALLMMSTQTKEFADVTAMVDEGFRRMVAPLGQIWEAMYPVAGVFMQIGAALGPALGAFLQVLQTFVSAQFVAELLLGLARAFLQWMAIVSAVYAVLVGLWSALQAFAYVVGLILFGPSGLQTFANIVAGVSGALTWLHDAIFSVAIGIIRAMAGMIDGMEKALNIDIKGEGALKRLARSLEDAKEDIDKIDWDSGKAEADAFLAQQPASATEQNINLPEAFKLAAARAAATDANGNGSWGSGAPSSGDMPIDRFTPVVNLTVVVNGVTQESAMEYADKSRGFRQLIESGIVMARGTPSLDPGRGRRNRN